ncbi:MAG: rod shape-determining protein RodA [Endomicrobium sp.]|jgi:rod shape determining protein RodA|nr:rod shape-determining protein RodA [Endomicrobium sp.]
MINKTLYKLDWKFFIPLIVLIGIGLISVYSACTKYETVKYFVTQLISCLLGSLACFFLSKCHYQMYKKFSVLIYIISLLLLCSVLIFGTLKRGTKGWLNLGLISLQPVEIAKIMFILAISAFFDKNWKQANHIYFLIISLMLLSGHVMLIMLQPDFSSTLSYFPIMMILFFVIGVKCFYLLCIVLLVVITIGIPLLKTFTLMYVEHFNKNTLLTNVLTFCQNINVRLVTALIIFILLLIIWWVLHKLKIKFSISYPIILGCTFILGNILAIPVDNSLKNYQKKRFIVFLNPKIDSKGFGYNIIQSKIAIGSGQFVGKGLRRGTQTQLGFLPEQHTDFIFSLIGEEGGWIMAQCTIIFYLIFIWRILLIAKESKDLYGSLVAIGFATMFMFYAVINIGMTMGLMPVTGMPLLLISYGGSSMVSSLCAVGILRSIYSQSHDYY